MGTDIHIQVQGKNSDGEWAWVKRTPFAAYKGDGASFDFDNDPTERNYNLFAILAGVRNGHGFAGSYRHEPVEPWFEGRGLPDGLTDEECHRIDCDDIWSLLDLVAGSGRNGVDPILARYKASRDTGNEGGRQKAIDEMATLAGVSRANAVPAYGDDWIGDHSFTHATLAELRDAPWDHKFHQAGAVERSYAPLVGCAFRRWVDGDVMQSFADEYGGPENVRVLMGFDS